MHFPLDNRIMSTSMSKVEQLKYRKTDSALSWIWWLLRCRNLALYRMFLQAWGLSDLGGFCTPPVHSNAPICPNTTTHLYAPCSPVHLYVSRGYLHMIWIWGPSITPYIVGLGGISTSVKRFWYLSVHPLFLSLWVTSY